MNDNALVKLDLAQHALAECKTVMEAKEIADVAEAARVYLERTNASAETVNRATEIRLLAERQMGEFLKAMPKATGGEHGGRAKIDGPRAEPSNPAPTLAEIGITKKQSAAAQKLAEISESEFRERVAVAKASGARLSTAKVLKLTTKTPPARARDVRSDGKRKPVVREITTARGAQIAKKALWRISTVAGQADAIADVIREVNMQSAFCLMTQADAEEFIRQFSNATQAITELVAILRNHKYEEKSIPIEAA